MKPFRHRFRVRAPLGRVAEFHHDSSVLKLLTPPPLVLQFHELQPLGEGSISDFTMWAGLLPIRWVATHSEVDLLHGFTDTQARGPFERWVHRHSFVKVDDNVTEVVDEIQAQPGKHPFWYLVSWFMRLSLPLLFAYRAWRTRKALE
jgi:ligand-binding SRPBCC domain-containing protein